MTRQGFAFYGNELHLEVWLELTSLNLTSFAQSLHLCIRLYISPTPQYLLMISFPKHFGDCFKQFQW